MAREKEALFAQSLMERLSEKQEPPHTQAGSLRFLKEAIRRDLEGVLNTRKPMLQELERYREACGTVLQYGLEDFSALPESSEGHLPELQKAIKRCLAEFEPRLLDVEVNLQSSPLEKREIRLQIEARLPLYPSVEVVYFDTILDLGSETYFVG